MVQWALPSLRPKRHVDRFSRFCTAHHRVSHYFTMRRNVFLQNCLFPVGDRVPHLTHGTYGLPESSSQTASRSVQPFFMGPKYCAVQCTVNGEENSQKCPFPLRFRHHAGGRPSYGHRQHAQKNRACGSGDILVDRQTGTHTQTCSSQYFATDAAGK